MMNTGCTSSPAVSLLKECGRKFSFYLERRNEIKGILFVEEGEYICIYIHTHRKMSLIWHELIY